MFLLDVFHWSNLLQPTWYIETFGVWIILFIVFAETGLLFGFFFPGDSLLFVAGVAWQDLEKGFFHTPFIIIMLLIAFCAIAGNIAGYWFGKKIGPAMYHWNDRWYFKQRHLRAAKEFYDKYGGGAIFMARFVPFVRTFAPIVAGIVQMEKKKFSFYSIISAFAWVFSMMLAGRYLHEFLMKHYNYDIRNDLEWVVLVIVLVTTLPVIIKLITVRKKSSSSKTDSNL
jgi:membrane-associated protein